jgi:hypothetical protein|eukprot:COSAG06_NODE_2858_length_6166_cov_5.402011_6_plen_36_part_00
MHGGRYEKGMSFLWYLQKVVGGDAPMEEFLVVRPL